MRAVGVREPKGRPEVLEVPRPEPGEGEVLVRVSAAGLNPLDWKIADGMLEGALPYAFPLVMGVDFAGVVESNGPGSRRFTPGDGVYGQVISDPVGGGTYAEFVVVDEAGSVALAPPSVPLTVAAGAPTAGMTALGIVDTAALREYESVLIVGAAGGVGTFLTQLASAHGLRVIAATHGRDERRMAAFGAAVTVDARERALADAVREEYPEGVDALVDLIAADPAAFAAGAAPVRNGGVALSTLGAAVPGELSAKGVEGLNFQLTASAALLDRLGQELDSGRLVVPVETQVPLEQAPDAVARNRVGGGRGKTVFLP
ncbi:NADP-dependent oxidoreductase [Streptomyces sp. NBC_01795]|uniref:NADP-dependent oxidoreductase n=1 Tax=unclassified Streptomyces TaxID=2593676 RepID=UPI002DD82652|nr:MULTISPECIES: NADP-dependent oxidoreductase [unclassified Streptomyces]WSA93759.1 NADP-dependent oxidoreductase [Streptomyces sp. NBC_01795]WSB78130.1 NADP-dependent oxidoreductase [Streptomyces sp. NBC_01775]